MKRVVFTGIGRDRAAEVARAVAGSQLKVRTGSDYEGVLALKSGEADYFVGICQSGAGGALALAVGLLGSKNCLTVSTAGTPPKAGAVEDGVDKGIVAFGLAVDHIEEVIPRLVKAITAPEA